MTNPQQRDCNDQAERRWQRVSIQGIQDRGEEGWMFELCKR